MKNSMIGDAPEVTFTGGVASSLLSLSESSLDDSRFARAAAFSRIFFVDTGAALIGSALFEVAFLLLSVFAIAGLS